MDSVSNKDKPRPSPYLETYARDVKKWEADYQICMQPWLDAFRKMYIDTHPLPVAPYEESAVIPEELEP